MKYCYGLTSIAHVLWGKGGCLAERIYIFTCESADACRTTLTASLANARTSSSLLSSLWISSVKTDITSLHVLLAILCHSRTVDVWQTRNKDHSYLISIRSDNQDLLYIQEYRVFLVDLILSPTASTAGGLLQLLGSYSPRCEGQYQFIFRVSDAQIHY